MRFLSSKLSIPLFLLIIICFFLPFVAISCDNKEVLRLSGVQLMTGTEVKQEGLLWRERRVIPAQPWAVLPFGLAVAGVVLGLGKRRLLTALRAVCGVGAATFLLLLQTKLSDNLEEYPKLVFSLKYLPGCWGAVGLSVLAGLVNLIGLIAWKRRK
jgi:hypothetical protein